MEKRRVNQPASGNKALALDAKTALVRYRLFQLLALILSAAFALGLHFIFGR